MKKNWIQMIKLFLLMEALQRNLGLEIREEQEHLLEGWGNLFYAQRERKIRQKMYLDLDGLLREIYERNQKVRFYEVQALLNALNAKWRYAKYREPENAQRDAKVGSLEEIFSGKRYSDYRLLWREYRSRSVSVKSDLKRLARYFHGLMLGLMLDLRNRYVMVSNRESGLGRYDILLEPRSQEDDGIIFEFKVFHPQREKNLEDTVQTAIRQIIDKKYAASLTGKGVTEEKIRIYGFAFKGKEVLIDGGYIGQFEESGARS